MTDAALLARFTDISEKNLFPVQFGDGVMLIGLPPNDIYQLGFFAAFNECHLAVREYVDQMLVKGILDQQREARKLSKGKADRPLWEKHKEQERQALIAALAERDRLDPDAPKAIVFKHDPYCDCGICQFCKGDEDKYGNPTKKGERETDDLTDAVKRMLILECSECDEARTENLKNVLLHACAFETRQFAKTAWKHGWIVEANKVLCPNCRADAEEWRSI